MPASYLVRDFMSAPATTLPSNSPLLEAALTMRRTGFRHLPVVEGEKLVGIITERDIHRFAPSLLSRISQEEYNSIFENTPLERVMTREPLTVTPATPITQAVAILSEKKLGCLPVVDGTQLVGIITTSDMLELLSRILTGAPVQK